MEVTSLIQPHVVAKQAILVTGSRVVNANSVMLEQPPPTYAQVGALQTLFYVPVTLGITALEYLAHSVEVASTRFQASLNSIEFCIIYRHGLCLIRTFDWRLCPDAVYCFVDDFIKLE